MTKMCVWASTSLLTVALVFSAHAQGPAPQGRGGGRGGMRDTARRSGQSLHRSVLFQVPRARAHRQFRRIHARGLGAAVRHDGRGAEGAGRVLADYLAKNFPEQPRPPAVLIPGERDGLVQGVGPADARLAARTIRSRRRTARSGTRGCLPTSSAGSISRPEQIKEFPLPTPQSGPHGLTADKDGNIWFTANSKGYIGKLDPKTGDVNEYQMPEAARDPHTPLFDPQRHPVVQRAGLEHGRPARSEDRRDQGRAVSDARAPTRTASSSTPRGCRSSASLDRTRFWRSIR